MNNLKPVPQELQMKQFLISSLLAGFLLIPVHEAGHVIFDWISGNPAGMSYARDYLLGNGKQTFLGELGGPLMPILIAIVSIIFIYKQKVNLSIVYPIAILGCMDRLILYITGMLPSDERVLAGFMNWDAHVFMYIFLSLEIILLSLIVNSFKYFHASVKMKVLCFLIPLISFIVMALFGVFIIEKNIFPAQFHLQFG